VIDGFNLVSAEENGPKFWRKPDRVVDPLDLVLPKVQVLERRPLQQKPFAS
jgi:hypothetical protein